MRQSKVELLQDGGERWPMYGCTCTVRPRGNGWAWCVSQAGTVTARMSTVEVWGGMDPTRQGAIQQANAAAIRMGRAPNLVK